MRNAEGGNPATRALGGSTGTGGGVRVVLALALVMGGAGAEATETLFLRDGSVLRGAVIGGPDNALLVESQYGFLTVDAGDVLYRTSGERAQPLIAETWALGAPGYGAVVTAAQVVPVPAAGATTFSLLISGEVTDLKNGSEGSVPWEALRAGAANRVTVRYGDLPDRARELEVTSRIKDALEPDGAGGLVFAPVYTAAADGRIRLVVRYPAGWKVESATPAPSSRAGGLLVWDGELRRQQRFSPRALFAE